MISQQTPAATRSNWVLVNGIRTHYTEAGSEGPAVVLCHGGGPGSSGGGAFRMMIPTLAQHFRVYALDQLSYGETDTRPHAWPTKGHQSLVDHVAGFIDALCLDQVMLLGQSQGAYVAAKYAVDNPERVKSLFLIASGTISNAMKIEMPMSDALKALNAYDGTPEKMRSFLEGLLLDKASITDELVQARVQLANRPGAAEARKAFEDGRRRVTADPGLFQRFDLRARLPLLRVPTLFVWGNQDYFAPADLGRKLEQQLPNIRFRFIDQAGHQAQNDQPELMNQLVVEHFSAAGVA
jgi:2-hydroxy-6-oxonona-2,4-dienedioate hydrolase